MPNAVTPENTNNIFSDEMSVPPSLFGYATENMDGNIDLFGSATGFADGTEVNVLITDDQGNSNTATATVQNGSFSIDGIWAGMFESGNVHIHLSSGSTTNLLDLELSGNHLQPPLSITSAVLDGNLIDVEGVAPALQEGTVLSIIVRDQNDTSITATTVVGANGQFSLQDINTQGLSAGTLSFDALAQDANGMLSLLNVASLELINNVPQGADKTVEATEDMNYVVYATDFGYSATGGYAMTGVKVAALPTPGTLKLNGVDVVVDQVISKADLDDGKLVFKSAQDGNGSNYAQFKFKVQDNRPNNNEDPVANSLKFNVTAVNDAPVLTTGSILAYTENGAPAPINTLITVADADNTTLKSATVTISGGYVANQDTLSFINVPATMGDIAGVLSGATMTLTSASGTATQAQWQAALRAVAYNNTVDNPTLTPRTISYTINDGTGTATASSSAVTSTITLTAVNDAPVLATSSTLTYTENDIATPINTLITVSDADNTTLKSATVTISGGYVPGQDILSFTNLAGTMGDIAGVLSGSTMTLTSASGNATAAQWQTALRAVAYNNTTDNPATAARTVSYVINDGTGSATANSAAVTSTINLTPVNDAPVLTTGSSLAYTENGVATPINTVITVSDADNTTLKSATVTISAGYVANQDTLSFTNVPATMGDIAGVLSGDTMTLTSASGNATQAQWQAALRAVAYNNTSDSPSTAARTVSYVINDGTGTATASSAAVTSIINLTAVNDAPVLTTGSTLSYTENGAAAPINTLITVADADNTTLQSATVTISGGYVANQDTLSFTNVPATMGDIAGVLSGATMTLTSASGTATQAQWQAALRAVAYNNTSDNPNTSQRTVSYVINDGTGTATANSTAVTSTINLTPVNDAPVLATGSVLAYTENGAAAAINTAITVADVDNTTLKSATVTISSGYVGGQDTLSFTNVAGTMGDIAGVLSGAIMTLTSASGTATQAQWQAALRAVAYNNTSDNPVTTERTVSYVINDGTNTATASSGTVTSTINLTAVNDAPVLTTGSTLAYTENGAAAPINTVITVADADNATLKSATVTISGGYVSGQDTLSFTNEPATMGDIAGVLSGGTMTLTSATGAATQAQWQAALRAVAYQNTSDNPTLTPRTVSYTINDGTATGTANSVAVTSTINLTAINDAPVLTTGSTLAYTENGTAAPINTVITVADADNATLKSAIVTISSGFVNGQDVLSFINVAGTMGDIAGVFSGNTMSLTSASGNATVAQWQAALRAVAYQNTSDNPTLTPRTVSYVIDDGTATATAYSTAVDSVINITAVNDPATINGEDLKELTESNVVQTTTGTLSITDVDSPTTFVAQIDVNGSAGYGKFSVNTAGVWTYTMNSAHNEFVVGQVYTDTFSVSAADGTTHLVTVKINGTNDLAAITGDITSDITQSTTAQTATGTLTNTDVDSPTTFLVQTNTPGSNGYGTFSLDAAGVWIYTMNSAQTQFAAGTSFTDSFMATAADGTTKEVSVTIHGVNDPAVIAGDVVKTMVETNAVQSVTGTLSISDVDSSPEFTAQTDTPGTSGYGKFSLTNAGVWTYTLDNAHNEFVDGQLYTDKFTAVSADGTTQEISVNITGSNDAPTVTSSLTTYSPFTENGGEVSARAGVISLSDIDSSDLSGASVKVVDVVTGQFYTGDVLTWTVPAGASITGNYNTSTGVLDFIGTGTKAQYEQLLNSVKFNNLREDIIGGARNVYWSVQDTQGGVSAQGPYSSVSVIKLNDAPVLADTNLSLATIQPTSADLAPSGALGVLVSTLVGGVTDADGALATKGIAIIGANEALGKVYFSENGGTNWYTPLFSLSPTGALLLKANANTRVYFRPNAGVEGDIADALTIRAWDGTNNKVTLNGSQVTQYNIATTGGLTATSAYSSATDTVSLSVASTASAGFAGTAGNDVMTGTAANEVMVGGGGADQINGGGGNDKIVLNADNVTQLSAANSANINGGSGINTLKLTGESMMLDLSNVTVQGKVDNFSTVDITGNGNNTLKLNSLNVQTLSGATDNAATTDVNEAQMLVVQGNAGDAVVLENTASWATTVGLLATDLSTLYGADHGFVAGHKYTQYSQGGATLFVDELTPVADIVGTSGNDVLTGTSGADVLFGNGGVDQISAGTGNDTVVLNASGLSALSAANTASLDGGSDVNVLKFSGVNMTLDLSNATVAGKVDNFTVIDLKQGSNNKVKLNLQEVLDLSGANDNPATAGVDESHMLVVQGNGGLKNNFVDLVGGVNWTSVTNLGGTTLQNTYGAQYGFEVGHSYTQYTNGSATLFVDQSLYQNMV